MLINIILIRQPTGAIRFVVGSSPIISVVMLA
jgi:hypothetical protein